MTGEQRTGTSRGIRNTVLACLAFMAVVLGLFVNNMLAEPVLSDTELMEEGIVLLPQPRRLADFELTATDGEPFTNADFRGRWNFVYFGFSHCPDICPISLSVMARAHRQLAEDPDVADPFRGMMVTLDPARDTVPELREFVTYFDPAFVGLTGDPEAIGELAAQVSVAWARVEDADAPDGYRIDHSGNIVIIGPDAAYRGYIRMPHSPEQVALALESLLARQ